MSWHDSQALVAEYSAANCLDGAPSAQSSPSLTPLLYCAPDRMTAFSRLFRFGMTCAPLTAGLGADLLTWFLAASLAKTSAQQARAQASPESAADCGAKWPASLARFDRASRSWKTAQHLLGADLASCSVTWPSWGTMRAGECWAQSMPERRTSATGSGLWPTPCTSGMDGGSNSRKAAKARMMWPTPDTCAGGTGPSQAKRNQPRLQDAVKFWATPNARDWKEQTISAALARANKNPKKSRQLPRQISAECPELHGGQLNPTWVEWLMGWPLEWTDLKPLATDKCQQWPHWHGKP